MVIDPERYTLEYCPYCSDEVVIYSTGVTGCPNCKKPLAPCSMCDDCISPCPYGCTGGADDEKKPITNEPISDAEIDAYMEVVIEDIKRAMSRTSGGVPMNGSEEPTAAEGDESVRVYTTYCTMTRKELGIPDADDEEYSEEQEKYLTRFSVRRSTVEKFLCGERNGESFAEFEKNWTWDDALFLYHFCRQGDGNEGAILATQRIDR